MGGFWNRTKKCKVRGVDEPLDRPPAFVPEEFFAFQAFAAPHAA